LFSLLAFSRLFHPISQDAAIAFARMDDGYGESDGNAALYERPPVAGKARRREDVKCIVPPWLMRANVNLRHSPFVILKQVQDDDDFGFWLYVLNSPPLSFSRLRAFAPCLPSASAQ
jgi:hypothetical protein